MQGVLRFPSLEDAMRAGFEQFDPPHFPYQPYWLVRTQTARGWQLAIAEAEEVIEKIGLAVQGEVYAK